MCEEEGEEEAPAIFTNSQTCDPSVATKELQLSFRPFKLAKGAMAKMELKVFIETCVESLRTTTSEDEDEDEDEHEDAHEDEDERAGAMGARLNLRRRRIRCWKLARHRIEDRAESDKSHTTS